MKYNPLTQNMAEEEHPLMAKPHPKAGWQQDNTEKHDKAWSKNSELWSEQRTRHPTPPQDPKDPSLLLLKGQSVTQQDNKESLSVCLSPG